MTPKQAEELKDLLRSLQRSVSDLRNASQTNTDFIMIKLEDLLAKLNGFMESLDV